jgi:hypothetical protein
MTDPKWVISMAAWRPVQRPSVHRRQRHARGAQLDRVCDSAAGLAEAGAISGNRL